MRKYLYCAVFLIALNGPDLQVPGMNIFVLEAVGLRSQHFSCFAEGGTAAC